MKSYRESLIALVPIANRCVPIVFRLVRLSFKLCNIVKRDRSVLYWVYSQSMGERSRGHWGGCDRRRVRQIWDHSRQIGWTSAAVYAFDPLLGRSTSHEGPVICAFSIALAVIYIHVPRGNVCFSIYPWVSTPIDLSWITRKLCPVKSTLILSFWLII